MLTQHIALVPEITGVNSAELARVSAALQLQIVRDFAPMWSVMATVDVFPRLEDAPVDYWPIIIVARHLGSEEGIHIDGEGQPFAMVEMSPGWSIAASHVCLEMLTNPLGSRTVTGPSPRAEQGPAHYLVEACGPCGGAEYAYLIEDVLVSDFCTPSFWEPVAHQSERYSFTGSIRSRRQAVSGGHLCWCDSGTSNWWLRTWREGVDHDVRLGPVDGASATVRELIAMNTDGLSCTRMTLETFEARTGEVRHRSQRACQFRAQQLRTALLPEGRRPPRLEAGRGSGPLPRRAGRPETGPEVGEDTINRVIDRISFKTEGGQKLQLLGALLRASLTTSADTELRETGTGYVDPEGQRTSPRPVSCSSTMTIGMIASPRGPIGATDSIHTAPLFESHPYRDGKPASASTKSPSAPAHRTSQADANPAGSPKRHVFSGSGQSFPAPDVSPGASRSGDEHVEVRAEELLDADRPSPSNGDVRADASARPRTLPPPLPAPAPTPLPPPPSLPSLGRLGRVGVTRDSALPPAALASQAPVARSLQPSAPPGKTNTQRLTFAGFLVAVAALTVSGVAVLSRSPQSDPSPASPGPVVHIAPDPAVGRPLDPPATRPAESTVPTTSFAVSAVSAATATRGADPVVPHPTDSANHHPSLAQAIRAADSAVGALAPPPPRRSPAARAERSTTRSTRSSLTDDAVASEPIAPAGALTTASALEADPIESLIVKRK